MAVLLMPLSLAALALTASLVGCRRSAAAPERLTLFVTGDSRGYLEPCGCRRDQAGGLPGRATLMAAKSRADRLALDVGNLTSGSRPYDLLKLNYLLEGMEKIGYDAVNLGKGEAELDLNTLNRVLTQPLPFVSANVLAKRDGRPVTEPFRILMRGGLKIGVTGVTFAAERDAGPGVEVKPPVEALAAVVPEMKRRCDYLIVLAFVDQDTIRKIADQYPEIDCILGGDVPQSSDNVQEINRAVSFNVMDRGKVLGQIDLKRQGDRYQVEGAHAIKVMGEHLTPDPAMVKLIASFKQTLRDKRYELASAEDMERIPGQESTADEYVGEAVCSGCHQEAHRIALATAHAHAFQTLVKKGSEFDPECLHCHTVGYALYSGFVDAQKTPQLANVQCENCHGRGKNHVAAMRASQPHGAHPILQLASTLRSVTPATCVRCHDKENSENFHYETFWPRIRH
jgi:hypothetical protein